MEDAEELCAALPEPAALIAALGFVAADSALPAAVVVAAAVAEGSVVAACAAVVVTAAVVAALLSSFFSPPQDERIQAPTSRATDTAIIFFIWISFPIS